MELPLWALPEHPGPLVKLEPRLLHLPDYALTELPARIVRSMLAEDLAQQTAAAGNGEADSKNELVAQRAGIVLVLF